VDAGPFPFGNSGGDGFAYDNERPQHVVEVPSFEIDRTPVTNGAYLLGMLGDCWEWTATEFDGYPGFEAWPNREYSEVFLGRGYRVLRGCSWASRPSVARTTFRNWDLPQRCQLFAGFRCCSA
jgi:formylglycine-generating enzyme required for sulfatase activity